MVPSGSLPKLGEAAEGYGYSLSATALEDPSSASVLYPLRKGYKLVAVEIVVGNVSGDELTVMPYSAMLVDTEGFVYGPEFAARAGQLGVLRLAAGQEARGWVAFSIPDDASPASIKYEVGLLPEVVLFPVFLQTGLTQ